MKRVVGASVFSNVTQASMDMGRNIRAARQARGWTMAATAERSLISLATYKKIEAGDPSVAFGFWLQTFFQLGLMDQVMQATAPHTDKLGEVLRTEQSPRRIRAPNKSKDSYDF